ncbi:hypothetical protein GCM10010372_08330 [Streptomyces tauricus]|nr:hypothetical protein GCM10010372_08330 [Streptomyces tauricus]
MLEESDEAESLPLSEQALRDSGRTVAAATITAIRLMRVFMVILLWVDTAAAAFIRGWEKWLWRCGWGEWALGFTRR